MGRAKYTAITQRVKREVAERDSGLCILCGKVGMPNAHVVNRSQGGLGIAENIVTLCAVCHAEMDNGWNGMVYRDACKDYLRGIYPDWNEEDVKFNKWKGVTE